MSAKVVAEFYDKVVRDDELKEKLKIVNEDTIDEKLFTDLVLPEAKKLGYEFTYEDVLEYYHPTEKLELNVDEMESVSGGKGCSKGGGGTGGGFDPSKYKEVGASTPPCEWYSGGMPKSCANCHFSITYDNRYYCTHNKK